MNLNDMIKLNLLGQQWKHSWITFDWKESNFEKSYGLSLCFNFSLQEIAQGLKKPRTLVRDFLCQKRHVFLSALKNP
jgi:hypothetical protein